MKALTLIPVLLLASLLPVLPDTVAQGNPDLEGRVCESFCHHGLPGADVELRRTDALGDVDALAAKTTSGPDGHYRFEAEDGTYRLVVSRQGFQDASVDVEIKGKTVRDVQMEGMEVTVDGTIKDADGRLVKGAYVAAYGGADWKGHEMKAPEGTFQLHLVAGHYDLNIEAPGFYGLYEYRLLDGSPLNITLERVPPQSSTVTGRVVDQDGAPVADLRIDVHQWNEQPRTMSSSGTSEPAPIRPYGGSNFTTTDADGRFVVNVHAGDVNLNAWKEGYASFDRHLTIKDGETKNIDITMKKFPAKTARIEGKAVDENGNPVTAIFVNIRNVEYGTYACSSHGDEPRPMPAHDMEDSMMSPDYHGCDITVHADGTFTGSVTPGYSTISVHFDHWSTCTETRHSDGSYSQSCGQDRFPSIQTLALPDGTTEVTAVLPAKPGPDAKLSGYVVGPSGTITQARLEINHMDTFAWGSAVTDGDGSYAVRLRSGMHHVRAYADGHFPWEGVVMVKPGDNVLDITLVEGESSGGCCYAYAEGGKMAPSSAAGPDALGYEALDIDAADAPRSETAAAVYEDLGGGLGPYESRTAQPELAQDTPLPLAALAGLLVALVLRRRD